MLPASSLPSGLNATTDTALAGPEPVWMGAPTGRPVAGSHARTVPSPSPVASSLPSGLNASACAPYTLLEVAWRVAAGRPVAGFHSRTVPAPHAMGSRFP